MLTGGTACNFGVSSLMKKCHNVIHSTNHHTNVTVNTHTHTQVCTNKSQHCSEFGAGLLQQPSEILVVHVVDLAGNGDGNVIVTH